MTSLSTSPSTQISQPSDPTSKVGSSRIMQKTSRKTSKNSCVTIRRPEALILLDLGSNPFHKTFRKIGGASTDDQLATPISFVCARFTRIIGSSRIRATKTEEKVILLDPT